ncbi:MAG: DUF1194 domain-containing protein [Silicimonas sp.]|nr:DUF1194 domain-containing protein [Silicimonas sp.]
MRLAALALALCVIGQPALAACRLALALALDISGSVDADEYRLQMSGLSTALADRDVVAALLASPDAPVAIAIYEWSSARHQNVIQDWTLIDSAASLEGVRARLNQIQRAPAPQATGLGAAMVFGGRLLDDAPGCWNRTLDISGDGKNNDWPDPRNVRAEGSLAGVLINGLVIAPDTGRGDRATTEAGELVAYFKARVIQGPDAFVEVAFGYEDYADAMRRKLLRELRSRPVGIGPRAPVRDVWRVGLARPIRPQ